MSHYDVDIHVLPSYATGIADQSKRAVIKQRIRDAKVALRRAEEKAARCRKNLERLMTLEGNAEASHWIEFRVRLAIGKQWAKEIDAHEGEALEVRELLAPFCDLQGRRSVYAQAFTSDREKLTRALVLGSLICERAEAHPRARKLLDAYLAIANALRPQARQESCNLEHVR